VGNHALTLHIVDYDGKAVIPPLNGNFGIQLADQQQHGAVNLILNLQGLIFKSYGVHAVNLAIDNRDCGSLPFKISQANQK
jgi:hypothetical protein